MSPNFTTESKQQLKKQILEYIKTSSRTGHYPTFMEIEEKFRTNIRTHFSGILDACEQAGTAYKRDPNPFLKYEKEQKLPEISVKILSRMGYFIEKISIGPRGSGPDIIVKNSNQKLIPVEIKAYHRFGKIKNQPDKFSKYLGNEVAQLLEYQKRMENPYGYLITSTDRKSFHQTDNRVKVLFFSGS
jgi:hypothetical protein